MDLEILKIASNTENHKVVKNHTHLSKNKNPICGDEMEITLLVKNDVIEDMGYQCKSCVYCQASVSMLSIKIKNKKIDQIKHLFSSVESFFDNAEIKINKEWQDFKKAQKILINSKINIKNEIILAKNSINRISAKNIYSPTNYPAGNNTAL